MQAHSLTSGKTIQIIWCVDKKCEKKTYDSVSGTFRFPCSLHVIEQDTEPKPAPDAVSSVVNVYGYLSAKVFTATSVWMCECEWVNADFEWSRWLEEHDINIKLIKQTELIIKYIN